MIRVRTFAMLGRAAAPEPLNFDVSGVDGIVLFNGFERLETGYGPGIRFENLDGLHKAIAVSIALDRAPLSARELRFLRNQQDMTQADIARLLKVDVQTVARYEKEQTEIPFASQKLVKIAYILAQLPKDVQLDGVRLLVDEENTAPQLPSRLLARAKTGWEVRVEEAVSHVPA